MSKPGTVSFTVKTKYLWLVVGLLLIVLAVSPVVSSYIPATTAVPSNGGGGSGGGGGGGGPSGPAVNCQNPCVLYIQNSVFGFNATQPTVVKAGTTVTWMNIDDTVHTSTSNSGVWDSGIIQVGHSFSFTFSSAGTFPYHCNVHPMTGTIVVVS